MDFAKSLAGKKGLVLGVANEKSIAWGIAKCLSDAGAKLGFTYQGEKLKKRVEPLAKKIDVDFLVECDLTDDAQVDGLFDQVKESWGELDFIIHSVAFAPKEELEGEFVNTTREGFRVAHDVSSYTLTLLCQKAVPYMSKGASIVAMSYLGGERVVLGYNVMGVAKASLEMSVRYLAADFGPKGIRVNAISAGPVNTLSARGVSGFTQILDIVQEKCPLRRNVTLEEIGATAGFLVSPLSGGITGEVIHVDGGFSIIGVN